MFNLVTVSTLLLAVASSVSGLAVVRRSAPATYDESYLERYTTYHTRYLAINCQSQHNTAFFDQCCHPLLATENLSTARPAQCIPSPSASASASAAEPTSTVTTPADDESDCDDSGDGDSSSAVPQAEATPAPSQPAASPVADVTPAPASSTSSVAPSDTPAPSTNDASAHAAPSTDNSDLITGGFATFFFQNGVPGACGTVHQDTDLIAAIDQDRYGDSGNASPLCGKQVEIHNPANGKVVVVTIADDCPTCNNSNSIDLSHGAFTQIADESQGIVAIEWKFL